MDPELDAREMAELRKLCQELKSRQPDSDSQETVGLALSGIYHSFNCQYLLNMVLEMVWKAIEAQELPGTYLSLPSGPVWLPWQADIESHLIESIARSAHSSADMVGQIVNSIFLDQRIPSDRCTLGQVVQRLSLDANVSNSFCQSSDFHELVTLLDDYARCEELDYLSAFVNLMKHYGLAKGAYHVSERSARHPSAIEFEAFKYKGKQYEGLTALELHDLVVRLRQRTIALLSKMLGLMPDSAT